MRWLKKNIWPLTLICGICLGITPAKAQVLPSPELSSPPDGAADQPTTLTLDWNAVSGATDYRVQLATTSDFSNPVRDRTNVLSSSTQISGLNEGVTYYWRVRASSAVIVSDWSEVWSFTTREETASPPAAPALVAPAKGATGVSTSPVLEWNTSENADTYHLQVATDSNFGSLVADRSGLNSTSQQIEGLSGSGTYYWRVRSANSAGYSGWSESWSFTTEEDTPQPPAEPALVSPANGATGVSTTPTLDWNSSNRAETYRVQVATDAGFTDIVTNQGELTATSRQISGLANATDYYWRVRASNSGGTSDWSEVWNFRTEQAQSSDPPSAPSLLSPADGSDGLPADPLLEWSSVQGAETYRIQVATDAGFSSRIINRETTSTSFRPTTLSRNTTYYWRVQANNSDGTSEWSAVWDFTTVEQPPFRPELFAPANGTQGIGTATTLEWQASEGADTYHLQVASDQGFSNLIVDAVELTSTSHEVSDLVPSSVHYWRVRASNEGGTSDWSEVWSFTTSGSDPEAPRLISPPDDATGVSTEPVLIWHRAAGAESYGLQLAPTQTFTNHVVNIDMGITDTLYQVSGLEASKTYYWRVQSVPDDGSSAWSAVWSFTTGSGEVTPPEAPVLVSPKDGSNEISTNPTLQWNSADRADSYQLQIATDAGFNSLTVNRADLTETEFNVSGLSYSTTYYWRVRASNQGGTGDWSGSWSFSTKGAPASPPPQPVLSEPANGATSVSVNPLFGWQHAEGAESYILQIAADAGFTGLVAEHSGISASQYRAEGLRYSTTYFWRVRASNSAGTSAWSEAWEFTTEATSPIVITNPKEKDLLISGQNYTISWSASAKIENVKIEYRPHPDSAWTSIANTVDASQGSYLWEAPGHSTARTRIKITDTANPSVFAVSAPFAIYNETVSLNHTYSFESTSSSSDYRLIGMPGRSSISLEQLFAGKQGKDWNAFRDNGKEVDYLTEYDGSEAFTLKPGRGFWAISRRSVAFSDSSRNVALNEDTAYAIPLQKGWNIISNPFNTPVSWKAVQDANGIEDAIWSFNGSYNRQTVLEPFHGYYYFNRNNLDRLNIPFKSPVTQKVEKQQRTGLSGPVKQEIRISVIKDDKSQTSAVAGLASGGTKRSYQFAPPGDFQPYKLTIFPEDIPGNHKRQLASDLREQQYKLQTFELKLKAPPGEQLQLIAEGMEKIYPRKAVLVDRQTSKSFDLAEDGPIYLRPDRKVSRLSLLIGNASEVEEDRKKIKADALTLAQNYPNPFNGQTVIEYSIPKRLGASRVRLEIFDVLGRKVYTLVNQQQHPGFYQVRWNGSSSHTGGMLASGVYYYRLRIGKETVLTKQLTLIK